MEEKGEKESKVTEKENELMVWVNDASGLKQPKMGVTKTGAYAEGGGSTPHWKFL